MLMRVLLACGLAVGVVAFDPVRFPGPYCETRPEQTCCPDRDDECTVPIHDTLCYCDQFCYKHSVEDCCPDYKDTCVSGPDPLLENLCEDKGKLHDEGDTKKVSCNFCECVRRKKSDGSLVQEWVCEVDACINEQSLLDNINRKTRQYGWSAMAYDMFDGMKVKDGIRHYLGTINPKPQVMRLHNLDIHTDLLETTTNFDSREEWPGYIHPPLNQAACGSSWAFSTIGVASDRWGIQSKGVMTDLLSVQNLISCNRFMDGPCSGARVEDAWWQLQRNGAMTDACYPYVNGDDSSRQACLSSSAVQCPDNKHVDVHVYKSTPAYRISTNQSDIMYEIKTQGPVQAIMQVHADFFLYERGVYGYTREPELENHHDHNLVGTHSVRLIGWGEERGSKYWLAANSWGTAWGEDGYFRIKRGENESGIEDFIVGVWLKVESHQLHEDKKKRRRHRTGRL